MEEDYPTMEEAEYSILLNLI